MIGVLVDITAHAMTTRRDSAFIAVIVGLPGVGKSTIGRRVARRLGWDFVDLDAAIESRSGRSIRDIFETDGEGGFRDIESQTLRDIMDRTTPCIVATGGGIVVRESNRSQLRSASAVVWMTAGVDDLEKRLEPRSGTGRGHRPLLDGDRKATLERLAAERSSLYTDVATDVVDTAGSTFDEVVETMLEVIAVRTGTHTGNDTVEFLDGAPRHPHQDLGSTRNREG